MGMILANNKHTSCHMNNTHVLQIPLPVLFLYFFWAGGLYVFSLASPWSCLFFHSSSFIWIPKLFATDFDPILVTLFYMVLFLYDLVKLLHFHGLQLLEF